MKKILICAVIALLCLTAYHYGRTGKDIGATQSAVVSDLEQTKDTVTDGISSLIESLTDR